MRSLLLIAAAVATGWVILVAVLAFFQRSLLYHPRPSDPLLTEHHRPGVVTLNVDGATLRGWFLRHASDDAPLVIYFGGNADEASYHLDQFGALRCCSALLVNYRGYGDSTGAPSERALRADGIALFDFAQTLRLAPGPTVLFGRSLGTGVAISTAAVRPVDAMVLISPYDSIAAVGAEAFPWAPVRLLLVDKFDCTAFAPEIRVPVLGYIAERDNVVRPLRSAKLLAALAGKVETVLVPRADHNTLLDRAETWARIDAWIADHTRH